MSPADLLNQLYQVLQTIFLGPHNYEFLAVVAASVLAAYVIAKKGFKTKVSPVESTATETPSAQDFVKAEESPGLMSGDEYLDSKEGEAQLRGNGWRLDYDAPPQVVREPDAKNSPPVRPAVYDPSMEKISNAFDSAKERMIDEFASAITRMKFKITLPEEGRPLQVEPVQEEQPPPTEGD